MYIYLSYLLETNEHAPWYRCCRKHVGNCWYICTGTKSSCRQYSVWLPIVVVETAVVFLEKFACYGRLNVFAPQATNLHLFVQFFKCFSCRKKKSLLGGQHASTHIARPFKTTHQSLKFAFEFKFCPSTQVYS